MYMKRKFQPKKKSLRKIVSEDYRYLQQKVSGRNVYRNIKTVYKRIPKHRHRDPLMY